MKLTIKTVASLVIAALMILSVFGFVLSYRTSDTQQYDYNGVTFTPARNGWKAVIDGREHEFFYHPSELSSATVPVTARALLIDAPAIKITYDDEEEPLLLGEVQYYMEQHLLDRKRVQRGTVHGTGVLPALTCANADRLAPVLLLALGNDTLTREESSCVTLTAATPQELIRASDTLTYLMLGVLED